MVADKNIADWLYRLFLIVLIAVIILMGVDDILNHPETECENIECNTWVEVEDECKTLTQVPANLSMTAKIYIPKSCGIRKEEAMIELQRFDEWDYAWLGNCRLSFKNHEEAIVEVPFNNYLYNLTYEIRYLGIPELVEEVSTLTICSFPNFYPVMIDTNETTLPWIEFDTYESLMNVCTEYKQKYICQEWR